MPHLVDSHCHLDFPEFVTCQNDAVARAEEAGVGRMITIGTKRDEFPKVFDIIDRFPSVYGALGVHPHEAKEGITCEELVAQTNHPKIVGIGETGLDFFYNHSEHDQQEACFREHIRAALQTGLPLIVHTRQADDATIRIITEEKKRAGDNTNRLRGVIHCFSSSQTLADFALSIGFYLSFSGILTFKKSDNVRAIAKTIPLDRLLVETDSPFLAPQSHRGKPCEPAYVVETAHTLATVKNVSFEEIAEHTTRNFFKLFNKVPPL